MTRKTKAKVPVVTPEDTCYLCDSKSMSDQDPRPLTDECFCYGCKQIICERHGDAPWGPHDPEEHPDYGCEDV